MDSAEETKNCPRCAEQIKKNALVCRYCSHEFSDEIKIQQSSSLVNDIPKAKKSKGNGNYSGCLFVLLAIAIFTIIVNMANKKDSSLEPAAEAPSTEQLLPALIGSELKTAAQKEVPDILRSIEPYVSNKATLKVRNWHWGENYSYAIAEGIVTNQGSEPIDNILAVVTFFDRSGNLITSDDALIDFRPLMPGQSSPFKVMAPYNPLMRTAGLNFKTFGGATIDWEEGKPSKSNNSKIREEKLIEIVQGYLISFGYLKGNIDRKIGNATIDGIKNFQKDYKLAIEGKVTPELAGALRVASQRRPINNKPNSSN